MAPLTCTSKRRVASEGTPLRLPVRGCPPVPRIGLMRGSLPVCPFARIGKARRSLRASLPATAGTPAGRRWRRLRAPRRGGGLLNGGPPPPPPPPPPLPPPPCPPHRPYAR